MDARIRSARPEDLPGILAIEDDFRASGASAWTLLSEATFTRKGEQGEVLVAVLDDQVVGYLAYTFLWGFPWIEYVRLLQPYRRRGIGTALVRRVENHMRARGHDHLYSSYTDGENGPRLWHESMGFRECGRTRWVWDAPDEIWMIKGAVTHARRSAGSRGDARL